MFQAFLRLIGLGQEHVVPEIKKDTTMRDVPTPADFDVYFTEKYRKNQQDLHNLYRNRPVEKDSGCSDEEIEELMRQQGVKRLPAAFVAFLKVRGRRGGFGRGGSILPANQMGDAYLGMVEWVTEEGIDVTPPADAFIFHDHENWLFWYFLTDNDDDNPPIYIYDKDEQEMKIHSPSFIAYFEGVRYSFSD